MEARKTLEASSEPSPRPRTVLVVDDEATVTRLLASYLEKDGQRVITRHDGQDALEALKKNNIDLLITDLKMPGMSGIELIRKVRELNSDLDIIVITGYGTMDVFMEAVHEDVSDFILKPVDIKQFQRTLDRVFEKKSLTENLLARTQQLLQAEKMATVGLLSTGIAHEINNPNTFIRTNLQLMAEYIKRLKPRMDNLADEKNAETVRNIILNEFDDMIKEALKGTERIQKIVAGIKHYAHMGDDSFDESVDIREVIAQAVNLVRSKLRSRIEISENYLNIREIKGHFSKLEQVFVNLLINAADAINEKILERRKAGDTDFKGLIDVSATVIEGDGAGGKKGPDYLILTFYDNGAGIPEKKLKKVFDPFFTTKSVGVGTGLGLYLCYEIIQQHGGQITVQSDEGEGTAFIIKLPVGGSSVALETTRPAARAAQLQARPEKE
ncbi:MAG: sensor histidine kinase [Candidatus Nitrospinota bacterium M3_3B_026]